MATTTMIETSQASKTRGARWSRLLLCEQREDAGIEDNDGGGSDFLEEDDNHDDIDDNDADEGCS